MDDFELGLSSGTLYKDDFYESFQAPKYYDFSNPRDRDNADEWFLDRPGFASKHTGSLKEQFSKSIVQSSTVQDSASIVQPAASSLPVLKKPPKGPLRCSSSKMKGNKNVLYTSGDSVEATGSSNFDQCSENEDPNQGIRLIRSTKVEDKGRIRKSETRILERIEMKEADTCGLTNYAESVKSGLKQEGQDKTGRRTLKATKKDTASNEPSLSPLSHVCRATRCAANNPSYEVPATVPQKKVLAARKAALVSQQDIKAQAFSKAKASKALFDSSMEDQQTPVAAVDEKPEDVSKMRMNSGTEEETCTEHEVRMAFATSDASDACSSHTADAGFSTGSQQSEQTIDLSLNGETLVSEARPSNGDKNYSSEFQNSCRRSGELPKWRRAIVPVHSARDSEAADYVVEQAVMLESAIKLLKLGDDGKDMKVSEEICTSIMATVCADHKLSPTQPEDSKATICDSAAGHSRPAGVDNAIVVAVDNQNEKKDTKQVFSFRAMRKENPQQVRAGRKRKSAEMNTRLKEVNCCKKIAAAFISSPPASMSSSRLALGKSKKVRITCPQPFRLRTEERGALKEIEFNKKVEQYTAIKEGFYVPPSSATHQSKVVSKPLRRKSFRVQKQKVKIAQIRVRSPVEVSIEMVAKDLQAEAKKQEMAGTLPELDEPKMVRRQIIHHAHPMPSFDRPFKPQRSTKKLTIPIEPRFHAINRRKTCTKHPLTTQ